uniref:Uncharacterized protein n=1 Tax=Knipowitschia caucasica TaxID=637954 RepID=A0AAV2MK69_KNICA
MPSSESPDLTRPYSGCKRTRGAPNQQDTRRERTPPAPRHIHTAARALAVGLMSNVTGAFEGKEPTQRGTVRRLLRLEAHAISSTRSVNAVPSDKQDQSDEQGHNC